MGFFEWLTIGFTAVFLGLCLKVYADSPPTPGARWAVFGMMVSIEFALVGVVVQQQRIEMTQARLAASDSSVAALEERLATARSLIARGSSMEFAASSIAGDSVIVTGPQLDSLYRSLVAQDFSEVDVQYDEPN